MWNSDILTNGFIWKDRRVLVTAVGFKKIKPKSKGLKYKIDSQLLFAFFGTWINIFLSFSYTVWLVSFVAFQQSESKTSSFVLMKSPSIIVASLGIIVASLIWSILDPTLEPHLREVSMSTEPQSYHYTVHFKS